MAGETKTFHNYALDVMSAKHNLASGGDTFRCGFISNTYASVNVAGSNLLSNFTRANNTLDDKDLIANDVTLAGAVATLDATDFTGANEWARDQSNGSTDIQCMVCWNETSANKECIFVMDMTVGAVPVSLQAGPISVTWNASGIHTITVTA